MKIKRFKAPDMRQAIKMVREEHGEDAVILSNRKTADGIEIISAIDYDEGHIEKMAENLGYTDTLDNPASDSFDADTLDSVSDFNFQENDQSGEHEFTSTQDFLANKAKQKAVPAATPAPRAPLLKTTATEPKPVSQSFPPSSQSFSGERPQSKFNSVPDTTVHSTVERDLEYMALQREISTLKGLLSTQFNNTNHTSIPHVHPSHMGIYARLQELGLRSDIAHEILSQLPLSSEVNEGWRKALALVAHKLAISEEDILEIGGFVALLGPTGVGKTTTLAKLAARYVLKHGREKVALVSTDTYRIAAQDQILSMGKMLGIPVYLSHDENSFKQTLSDLYDKQFVLIDTPGTSQRDKRGLDQLGFLKNSNYPISKYLVISANTQELALNQIAQTFSRFELSGSILTKVDETASLGGVLSMLIKWKFPVAYISEGQRIPEDLLRARPYSLVSKAVTMMQQSEIVMNSGGISLNNSEELFNAHAQ